MREDCTQPKSAGGPGIVEDLQVTHSQQRDCPGNVYEGVYPIDPRHDKGLAKEAPLNQGLPEYTQILLDHD